MRLRAPVEPDRVRRAEILLDPMRQKGLWLMKKDDAGKPDYSLLGHIAPDVFDSVVRVLEHGAEKYGRNNWSQAETLLEAKHRYGAALMRHAFAALCGEYLDDGEGGTGEPHLSCVIVNALFLLSYGEI